MPVQKSAFYVTDNTAASLKQDRHRASRRPVEQVFRGEYPRPH